MANGTIRLRSGEWAWHTMELRHGETQEVRQVYYWFYLTGAEGSRMYVQVGPGADTIEQDLLMLYARHPKEREVLDESGTKWTFIQLGRSALAMGVSMEYRAEPYSVLFHSQEGRHRTGDLPMGCGLGDATDEELLSMTGGAG